LKDAKEQLVAAVARYNEILRSGAKSSIKMEVKGKTKVLIVSEGGASHRKSIEKIDDAVFSELVGAESFEVEINMKRAGPMTPKIVIWYDDKIHRKNSLGVEFIGEFVESVTFSFLGFMGRLNEIKASAVRSITDSYVSRMQFLWEDVFHMYVGGAMTKSEQKFNLRKYEIDSLMINVFGNLVKIRENI